MTADETDGLAVRITFVKVHEHDLALATIVLWERLLHRWVLLVERFVKFYADFLSKLVLLTEPNVVYFVLVPLEVPHDSCNIVEVIKAKQIVGGLDLLWDLFLDIFQVHHFIRLSEKRVSAFDFLRIWQLVIIIPAVASFFIIVSPAIVLIDLGLRLLDLVFVVLPVISILLLW